MGKIDYDAWLTNEPEDESADYVLEHAVDYFDDEPYESWDATLTVKLDKFSSEDLINFINAVKPDHLKKYIDEGYDLRSFSKEELADELVECLEATSPDATNWNDIYFDGDEIEISLAPTSKFAPAFIKFDYKYYGDRLGRTGKLITKSDKEAAALYFLKFVAPVEALAKEADIAVDFFEEVTSIE